MRTSLGLTVLAMGLLGMVLAMVTGEIYRKLALENQLEAFERLAKIKVDDILDQTIQKTAELGLSIQTNQPFRAALQAKDSSIIQTQLNEQFHRYFVTLSIIKLEKLFAFDSEFNLVGLSSEGEPGFNAANIPCPGVIADAKIRTGAHRLKTMSRLCSNNNTPHISVIVPVGGIRIQGYLMVVSDPTNNLSKVERALGMPLTLRRPSMERAAYKSPLWPSNHTLENIIFSNYTLTTHKGEPLYTFSFASDITGLHTKLEKTRSIILITASLTTLVTAMLALILLQRTAINPLANLTQQLRRVRQDKTHLGEKVTVSGNTEISELAEDFNDMSSELYVLYQTLETMAFTDSLTNLPNRALFYDRLEQSTLTAKRQGTPFLLLMLDLDRFKFVNDTLGHHIGDQLLQEVAGRLQESVRKSDTIARLGGDEFAAILTGVDDVTAAEIIARKILETINEPINIDNHTLTVCTSIGIVRCPHDGTDNHQLMQRADMAMYHAKHNREGYTFYESYLDKHSLIQLNLEADLYEAIEKNQLELLYQPKIDTRSGRTTGVEALIRWDHPQRGYLTPDEFVPMAEQTGAVQAMTCWVLEQALADCALWHSESIEIHVAINLSARSLGDSTILDAVSNTLAQTGIGPEWLSLELTESAVMANPDHAMEMLTKLHHQGVRISVDDFGTGYSSLAYLKKLPVSDIKIDKSFVMDMHKDGSDAVIVRSTIDLAHNMGLSVIAEGVDNKTVWEMLLELGCDVAQGHYMCKPLKAKELKQWILNSPWGYKPIVRAG